MAGGIRVAFEFYGDKQIERTIMRFEDTVADARPAWEVLRQRFLAVEERQFASGGRYSGGWPPLSPKYAAWKAKHYPGRPILVREGILRNSLTEGPDISIMLPQEAIFGSADPVGEYHQQGAGNLPRRRVVEFSENERSEWVKVLQRYIITGIAR